MEDRFGRTISATTKNYDAISHLTNVDFNTPQSTNLSHPFYNVDSRGSQVDRQNLNTDGDEKAWVASQG